MPLCKRHTHVNMLLFYQMSIKKHEVVVNELYMSNGNTSQLIVQTHCLGIQDEGSIIHDIYSDI